MRQKQRSEEEKKAFERAFSLHQAGQVSQAKAIYLQLLNTQKKDADLLRLLGTAEYQLGNLENAVDLLEQSLAISPDQAVAHNNRGNALQDLQRFDEALSCYDAALTIAPHYAEAYCNRGSALQRLKRLDEALTSYDRALTITPDSVIAYNNRGNILLDMQRLDEALASYNQALLIDPLYAEAHINRGNALREMKRHQEALACFDQALSIAPGSALAYNNKGTVLQEMKQHDEALASYNKALALHPYYADAYNNVGNVLQEMRRFDEALACYEMTLSITPSSAVAYNNRGNVLLEMKRFDAALESFDRALSLRPEYAEAHNNRGNVLQDMRRPEEALASYDRALTINPQSASTYKNRGNLLQDMNRLEEALDCYEKALAIKPEYDFLLGECLYTRLKLCKWQNLETDIDKLEELIAKHQPGSSPLIAQALIESAEIQRNCAEIYAEKMGIGNTTLQPSHRPARQEKIRIAYFSSDFGDHPVSHLLAGLFEAHDRTKFEIIGFSLLSRRGQWHDRVAKAFDQFIEVESKSDTEIISLARSMEIDIAIDLNGFTKYARTRVFAGRVAPIQVSYIGFLGTMGAPCIDYLIADRNIIPEGNRRFFSEKIAYLPVYQCNDDKQQTSAPPLTRQEAGLPEKGFVFCSFNNNYKITPRIFASWTHILKQVPDSVLWLYASNETARNNLKVEAIKLGLEPDRLIFAPHLPYAEHLSRQRLADLFLDTHPYNAGATASNALRIGLPVLTRQGSTFASRVGASLLSAVGMPELITETLEQYETLAIELAKNHDRFDYLKQKLNTNLHSCPLFNTEQFSRNIESAYIVMEEIYRNGFPATDISL